MSTHNPGARIFRSGTYSIQQVEGEQQQPSEELAIQPATTYHRWTPVERKAAYILGGIAASEGVWVYFNVAGRASRFWRYTGFNAPARSGTLAWMLSLALAAFFVTYAARLPSVRQTLWIPSRLKLLGLAVAFGASLCEEVVFRRLLMEALRSHGLSVLVQVVASALVFGLLHGIWGIMGGNLRAATGAILATGALGALLAGLYLASHRILAPCILAHFLIDAFAEPGLVLAGLRGEMGRPLPHPSAVSS